MSENLFHNLLMAFAKNEKQKEKLQHVTSKNKETNKESKSK